LTYLQQVDHDKDLPQLIITALAMHDISGLELLQALNGTPRYQHIPVVVHATFSLQEDVTACLAAGATQYLSKPCTLMGYKALSTIIKDYLR